MNVIIEANIPKKDCLSAKRTFSIEKLAIMEICKNILTVKENSSMYALTT